METRGKNGGADELLALVGATAVGKTAFGLELAARLGAHIVSMDSMQVYRGMDIGTAKPTTPERARVPHACLDLVPPSERYDVRRYLQDARAAVGSLRAAGRKALFVGGAGLYLRALAQGIFAGPPVDPGLRAALTARARAEGSPVLHEELACKDPVSATRIHKNDEKRVVRALEVLEQTGRTLSDWQREWGATSSKERPALRLVALELPAELLEERIRARIRSMLDLGWAEEARSIRDTVGFGPTAAQALGYREVLELADGRATRAATEERLLQLTRQLARRQRTWFRSFPEPLRLDPREPDSLARAEAYLASGS